MESFMNQDFLLTTQTAKTLYHQYAKDMPIIDFHCHINPQEIAEDRRFDNITQAWLAGDHYKWRTMRSNGIEEKYVTGDASEYEKFEKFAQTLPRLIGNPMVHWCHLELQRYMGIDEVLDGESCRRIWEACEEKFKNLSVRQIIRDSNVEIICTTDDPIDDLRWHRQIAESGFETRVLPSWRPDKALGIEKPGFLAYISTLSQVSGIAITSYETLCQALKNRMDFFAAHGCINSDHGLDAAVFEDSVSPEAVMEKALSGQTVSLCEANSFRTALLGFLAGEYRTRGWVMEIHFGAVRNNSLPAFRTLGPDTGYDAIRGSAGCGEALGALLGKWEDSFGLPKTILYSLNPTDNAQIGAMIGCFQSEEARGKIQQGSAWWFNDTKQGMIDQLTSLANLSVLGNFVGMVTDSRSFLSYTRHEYFRRILCSLLGQWVENGEYPARMEVLGELVKDICYRNCKNYFGF